MASEQTTWHLSVSFPKQANLPKDILRLEGFRGHEGLSQLFCFELDLLSERPKEVPLGEMIGQNVTIEVKQRTAGEKTIERYFNGYISRFTQHGRDSRYTYYRAEVVPWLWFLTQRTNCRIFQHKTVPQIIELIFSSYIGMSINTSYKEIHTERGYCVQYRESDFDFISRLMEEEGIFYFFSHTSDQHWLVLRDVAEGHDEEPIPPVMLQLQEWETEAGNRITEWDMQMQLRSGKHTLRDYHFEKMSPKQVEGTEGTTVTLGANNVPNQYASERYDYPGGYAKRFTTYTEKDMTDRLPELQKEAKRAAELRMQEEETTALQFAGTSTCAAFRSGYLFEMTVPLGEWDNQLYAPMAGKYLLTSVQHSTSQRSALDRDGVSYVNTFSCIPHDVKFVKETLGLPQPLPYRPPRVTPKPIVEGPQTAVVVGQYRDGGPSKEDELWTDKYGRVRVKFHWDRTRDDKYMEHDEDSGNEMDFGRSCWIRVAQSVAGKRWGASFVPRIGQEVVVAFLEGDPDRPLIVGSVYNEEQMPPYLGDGLDKQHKRNPYISGVKTNSQGGKGFNELRFDDTKGKEQVFLHAERDMDVRVKKSRKESVGSSQHLSVGGEQREKVGANKHVEVTKNYQSKIGGSAHVTVTHEKREHIGENMGVYVGGELVTWVTGNAYHTVKGDLCEQFKSHATLVENDYWIKAKRIAITAESEICLQVGTSNFITINDSGVAINGTMVNINGAGSPSSVFLNAKCVAPKEPEAPKAPASADNSVTGEKSAPTGGSTSSEDTNSQVESDADTTGDNSEDTSSPDEASDTESEARSKSTQREVGHSNGEQPSAAGGNPVGATNGTPSKAPGASTPPSKAPGASTPPSKAPGARTADMSDNKKPGQSKSLLQQGDMLKMMGNFTAALAVYKAAEAAADDPMSLASALKGQARMLIEQGMGRTQQARQLQAKAQEIESMAEEAKAETEKAKAEAGQLEDKAQRLAEHLPSAQDASQAAIDDGGIDTLKLPLE